MDYLNVRTMEKSEGLRPSDNSTQVARPQSSIQEPLYNASQPSDISVPENVILQTANYGMFKFNALNRAIRQDKLDRLYDAISKKNLLHLFPIVVTRNFTVVDGQHRLKAAEALGIPIYYIVSGQMEIEDAARVNANVAMWRMADYLDHFCKLGVSGYLQFKDFWADYPFLTLTSAIRLFTTGVSFPKEGRTPNYSVLFADGNLKAGNLTFANKVASMARDFGRWVTFWKDTKFTMALSTLADHPEYDHHRMMQKMEYLSVRLVKCPDIKGYINVFEQIYNHKATERNRVHFVIGNKVGDRSRTSRNSEE